MISRNTWHCFECYVKVGEQTDCGFSKCSQISEPLQFYSQSNEKRKKVKKWVTKANNS